MQAGYANVFEEEIVPSYNVAPQTLQPVVRLNRDSGERGAYRDALGTRTLVVARRQNRIQRHQRESLDADHQRGFPGGVSTTQVSGSR